MLTVLFPDGFVIYKKSKHYYYAKKWMESECHCYLTAGTLHLRCRISFLFALRLKKPNTRMGEFLCVEIMSDFNVLLNTEGAGYQKKRLMWECIMCQLMSSMYIQGSQVAKFRFTVRYTKSFQFMGDLTLIFVISTFLYMQFF